MRELLLVALLALALSACVAPPKDVDVVPDFDPAETVMGQIQERGVLRVGVPEDDWAPFWIDPEGEPLVGAGFIVALSQELGNALGVDVEYLPLSEDDLVLPGRIEVESPVDISFVQQPETEELAKAHPLTHPYWVGHQRLLVRADSGIRSVDDLTDSFVCGVINPETDVEPEDLREGVEGAVSTVEGCTTLMKSGTADAVTATDMTLMSIWAGLTDCEQPCEPSPDYKIVGDELTTVGYGAMLPTGVPGWTNFVNETWAETDVEGRWMRFYEEWISPYGIEVEAPPEMRIEEAAGLYPST